MTIKLKIIQMVRGFGLELPRELLEKLGVDRDGVLHATELPDGVKLTPNDPELEEQMQIAEAFLRDDREVIKRLVRY
ncbi:MAG TPA: AbrB/MazE/SpoVT family DNA-binding domain-containing protein [Nevskiaceae bacterium]|nr:AbrB/MazE/SpoVT family DNA-binding domain-containing protein [Nevskiaceae bacterium]